MRRKSERASKKAAASPEKVEKPEKPKRGRASRRRKASSSEAESAEEEGPQVSAVSAAVVPATEPIVEPSKELAPTEIELGDDKVWQVKAAESTSGLGEIKKLKICLTPRPPPTPERERSPRGRKKLNRTVSSSDTLSEGSDEKRKRRHRSRRLGRDSKDEAENLLEEEEVEDQTKAPSDEPNFTRKEKEDTNQKDIVIPQDSVSIQEHPESTTGEPEKAAGAVDATIVLEKDLHDNAQKAIRQADTTGDSNIEEASKKQREKRHKKLRKEASRSSTDREESPEHDSRNELKPKDLPHQVQVTETKSVKTDDIKFERNNPEVSIPHDSEEGKSQEPERAKSIMEPEYTSEQKQTFEKTSQAEPNIKSVTEPVHITSTQDSPVEPAIEIISKDDRTLRSQSHKISDVPMAQSKNEVFESIKIDKAQTGEKIRSDSEIDKEIKSNSTTIHDSSDAEKDKKPASNATQQDNSNDVKNDILKSKATRQDSSTVDKGDDKKSTTTRQDSSDADNDHRLKSKTKRQDSSDAEKESYIGNPLTNSVIQNHTKDKKDDVIMNMEETSVENYVATPIVVSRKRRWGTRVSKSSQARPVSISTDILKDIIPDVKPVELEEVIYEKRHKKKLENVEKHRVERPVLPKIVIDNTENVNLHRREERERDRERSERERERNEKERERSDRERQRSEREKGKENSSEAPLLEHRKISIVKEDNFVGRPPSPSRHKPSSVLYITNLVRPFTLAQLKNLLQRTGKLIQDGFWIDRIKSKCFVTYENEEQAVETRHALHGVTWPVSNPKTLQVDFSSSEALERMRKAEEEGGGAVSTVPGTVEDWLREQDAKKERFGENDEAKPWERRNVVREWDMGKGDKEKEKLIKRDEKPLEKRRHKTPERSPEPARKFKKKEEEAPAKMLDDLFRKTKAIPCIYWLPLSAETIAVKEEQRRQHMAEHERRMQELERSRAHRRH